MSRFSQKHSQCDLLPHKDRTTCAYLVAFLFSALLLLNEYKVYIYAPIPEYFWMDAASSYRELNPLTIIINLDLLFFTKGCEVSSWWINTNFIIMFIVFLRWMKCRDTVYDLIILSLIFAYYTLLHFYYGGYSSYSYYPYSIVDKGPGLYMLIFICAVLINMIICDISNKEKWCFPHFRKDRYFFIPSVLLVCLFGLLYNAIWK